jgi:hypothetical protein
MVKCDVCEKELKTPQALAGHKALAHGDHSATHRRVKKAVERCFRMRGFDNVACEQLYAGLEAQVDYLQTRPRETWPAEIQKMAALVTKPGSTADQDKSAKQTKPDQGKSAQTFSAGEGSQASEGSAGLGWLALGGLALWLATRGD